MYLQLKTRNPQKHSQHSCCNSLWTWQTNICWVTRCAFVSPLRPLIGEESDNKVHIHTISRYNSNISAGLAHRVQVNIYSSFTLLGHTHPHRTLLLSAMTPLCPFSSIDILTITSSGMSTAVRLRRDYLRGNGWLALSHALCNYRYIFYIVYYLLRRISSPVRTALRTTDWLHQVGSAHDWITTPLLLLHQRERGTALFPY